MLETIVDQPGQEEDNNQNGKYAHHDVEVTTNVFQLINNRTVPFLFPVLENQEIKQSPADQYEEKKIKILHRAPRAQSP